MEQLQQQRDVRNKKVSQLGQDGYFTLLLKQKQEETDEEIIFVPEVAHNVSINLLGTHNLMCR